MSPEERPVTLRQGQEGRYSPLEQAWSIPEASRQGAGLMDAPTPVRPSETQDYIRCPRYWYWKHVEGWEPPASAWTPDRLMGSAVHAGLAAWWRGAQPFTGATADMARVFDLNWPFDAPMEYSREGLETQALKVLDAVLKWISREMPDAQPLMVEQALGEDGHTTPDLVTREQGQLVITDWKTSWNVPADRVQYRLQGAYRDHQFLHYCWAVGQHLGEPVGLFRKVVIVGSPKILVRDVTFTPSPEAIEYWLTGARQMWEDMREMRARATEAVATVQSVQDSRETVSSQATGSLRVPTQNTNGCKMYGDKYPCSFYDACWTCHGDPAKMSQFLTRSPR